MSKSLTIAARAAAIEPSMIRTLRDKATPDCLDLGLGQADLAVHPAALDAAIADGSLADSPALARTCPGARRGLVEKQNCAHSARQQLGGLEIPA